MLTTKDKQTDYLQKKSAKNLVRDGKSLLNSITFEYEEDVSKVLNGMHQDEIK